MKTSKKVLIGLLAVAVVGTGGFLTYSEITRQKAETEANTKPLKVIGTDGLQFTYLYEIATLEDLIHEDCVIVLGTLEEPKLIQEASLHPESNATAWESYYRIDVEDYLTGVEGEEIIVCMLGKPDTGMTKPKVGEKVVMFLGRKEDGTFAVSGFEKGVFRVFEDGTVESFSNEKELAKYDGKSLNVLIDDIKNAVNKKDSEKQ